MRYFKPGSNEGKSLYIPLPLEFMAKKAEQEQASIDAVKNTAGELYGQINFNAIPEQERFKTAKINEYTTAIDNLATEVNQNPENWSTIGTKVNALAQKFNTDEDILSMENTYTGAATRLKDVRENGAEHNIWVDDYPLFLQQQKASDKLLSYDYKGSKKVLDWDEPAQKFMADIKPDKVVDGKTYVDPTVSDYITKKTTGNEYVTYAMIAQTALDSVKPLRQQLAFNDYLNKQAYEATDGKLIDGKDIYYEYLANLANKDNKMLTTIKTALGKGKDEILTKDDMMDYEAYSYLYAIGKKQERLSTSTDIDKSFINEWVAKREGRDVKETTSTEALDPIKTKGTDAAKNLEEAATQSASSQSMMATALDGLVAVLSFINDPYNTLATDGFLENTQKNVKQAAANIYYGGDIPAEDQKAIDNTGKANEYGFKYMSEEQKTQIFNIADLIADKQVSRDIKKIFEDNSLDYTATGKESLKKVINVLRSSQEDLSFQMKGYSQLSPTVSNEKAKLMFGANNGKVKASDITGEINIRPIYNATTGEYFENGKLLIKDIEDKVPGKELNIVYGNKLIPENVLSGVKNNYKFANGDWFTINNQVFYAGSVESPTDPIEKAKFDENITISKATHALKIKVPNEYINLNKVDSSLPSNKIKYIPEKQIYIYQDDDGTYKANPSLINILGPESLRTNESIVTEED